MLGHCRLRNPHRLTVIACTFWKEARVKHGGLCTKYEEFGTPQYPAYRYCNQCARFVADPARQLEIRKAASARLKAARGTAPKPQPPKWKLSWHSAVSFIAAAKSRGLTATALDAAGVANQYGERVDEPTFLRRVKSCFGSEGTSPCPHLKVGVKTAPAVYCGQCGCGEAEVARLSEQGAPDYAGSYTKLHYPVLECPINQPGFHVAK